MRYVVIEHFCDMSDNGRSYKVGDSYPRKGLSVADNRMKALAGTENALRRPLIKLVESEVERNIEKESEKTPVSVETTEKPVVETKSRSRRKKEQAEK